MKQLANFKDKYFQIVVVRLQVWYNTDYQVWYFFSCYYLSFINVQAICTIFCSLALSPAICICELLLNSNQVFEQMFIIDRYL